MSRGHSGTGAWRVCGVLLLACCADEGAPQADAGVKPAAEAHASGREVSPLTLSHRVQEKQTLWDIAVAYGLAVEDVMDANGLRSEDVRRLRPGTELRIVGPRKLMPVWTAAERAAHRKEVAKNLPALTDGAYHFLAEGETLWDLAELYDKSVDDLVARNELSDDDVRSLRPGTAVIVPGITDSQVRKSEPRKRKGIVHTMERGETVWDLASAFQVGAGQIMAANGLDADEVTRLREGARLFIPGVTKDRKGRVQRKEAPRQKVATRLAHRLGLGDVRVARKLLGGRVESKWIRAAGGVDKLPGTIRWPVTNGWYVRGYGSGEGGYHLAVDIMGEIGWNVRAAAPGIVAYSGNGVRGYGNMVLVIHPGGWVTMYAHNSVNFVVAGERVPRGGILAEVGSTGISRGPHVHFELIYDGKNCDPAPLFRPGVRHRNGRRSHVKTVLWSDPEGQPRPIKCDRRRRHPNSRWVVHEDPEADADK